MFPKNGASMETNAHSRVLLNISFGVPSKGALLRVATVTDHVYIQGDSVARGPKLLSIKNYVIEIMT